MPDTYDLAFAGVDAASVRPGATTPATSTQFNTLRETINTAETNALNSKLVSANSAANSMVVYGGLLSRNATINEIAQDMTAQNLKGSKGAKDTFSRQNEINEWQAQNKMDTLFFLQILFLYFALVVVSLYFRQIGIFPSAVFYMIVGLGLVIVLGVLWNRASYTHLTRDKRYWNRRYIGLDDSGLSAKLQCSLSASS